MNHQTSQTNYTPKLVKSIRNPSKTKEIMHKYEEQNRGK